METFGTLVMAGLANGSLYALVALGLVLIYRTQDVVNFAHGEILMVGGFVGYSAFQIFGFSYPLAMLAAIIFCGLLGAVLERTVLRPVSNHHHITLAMVTIGLSFALRGVARLTYGSDIYTFPPMFVETPSITVFGVVITTQSLVTIVAALVLGTLIYLFFKSTTLGKQMRATQQNATGARLVGINTGRVFSITWALASAAGAAAGVLAAPMTLLYPDVGTNFLLKGFAAAVLGGFDNVHGAIIGGLVIGIIEMVFGGYISTAFQHISAFCVIMFVLFVRPNGLFGRKQVKRV